MTFKEGDRVIILNKFKYFLDYKCSLGTVERVIEVAGGCSIRFDEPLTLNTMLFFPYDALVKLEDLTQIEKLIYNAEET